MKFSVLKNEISNARDIPESEFSIEISNDAVQEIQEKYLKNIYGGAGGDRSALGEFNGWVAFNSAF